MDIFKVIGIAVIGAVISLVLKSSHSPFAVTATIATGVIILIIVINSLGSVIVAFEEIVDKSGIDNKLFVVLLKIIGIGYLTEYGTSLCNDMGCAELGKKLGFAGKIAIFLMALPIVKAMIEIISTLVA